MSNEDNSLEAQLARWSESLAAIARTGLAFTQNLYERERYEEVLHVAADIKAAFEESTEMRRERGHFVQEWIDNIGECIPGYVTPKVAIGAIVGNEAGEILLVKRAPSGVCGCIPQVGLMSDTQPQRWW